MTDQLTDELLNEYLDGELDETQQQAVAAAIARSPEAQTRLLELEALFATLADVQDIPLPADLTPHVLTAVTTPPPSPYWLRLLPLAQVATAVLLVALFWGTLQSWRPYGRALLAVDLPSFTLPDVGTMATGWMTAVTRLLMPSIQFNLPVYQWAALIGLALVIWLLGARLLFADPTHPTGGHSYEK